MANKHDRPDSNRDPVTGEAGSHPVGTGLGAAGGGITGAAIGSVAGPPGAVFGGVVGAVAGGLVGSGLGEKVDPTVEEQYWRENHSNESYARPGYSYDDYQGAYRTGWEARAHYQDRDFESVEPELRAHYDSQYRGDSRLEWEDAKHATRAAWHRVERAMPGDADGDGR